jgi:outer membrane protein assembly factor BamD
MKTHCLAWMLAISALAGCATKKHLSPDEYFNNATEHYRGGALTLAIDEYHELLDQYPFSDYNDEAELKIAHAHYLSGNYAEAIVALTDFQRRHPTSPHLPFVGYTLGMCYVQQMGTADRDQTAARSAQNYFLTVSQQYPDSPFADLARIELGRCRERLAEHELYVADFYSKRGNRLAAKVRLLTLASRYEETDAAVDGLMQLATLCSQLDESGQEVLAYQAVTKSHPASPQAATARQALEGLKAESDPAGNPVDVLLAQNGRRRSEGSLEPVQVPGLDTARTARGPSGGAPALAPPIDPFGRGSGGLGRSGRPY